MIEYHRFKKGRQGGWFLHFSPSSRDQLKAYVLTYPHRLPSPAPTLVSNAAPVLRVLPHGIWNRSCIANRNDEQLSENVSHQENVKHLIVLLALIHDTGTALQKPLCLK
jgi:hypothetical protein